MGEPPVVPCAAAPATAINGATGVRLAELPMTAETVFRALHLRPMGIICWKSPIGINLTFPELRTTFGGASRVPAISIYQRGRVPVDSAGELEDNLREPPDITVEIASPEQSVNALVRRCLWYVANGVTIGLLVDPADESVLAFRPGHPAIAWHGQDRIDVSEVLPDLQLTVDELFASVRLQ